MMNLEEADQSIRMGWMAGFVLVGMAMTPIIKSNVLDLQGLISVLVPYGLAIGVNKKSRHCAVALFVWFVGLVIVNLYLWVSAANVPLQWTFVAITALTYFAYEGIRGTYAYRSLIMAGQDEVVNVAEPEEIIIKEEEKKIPRVI